MLMNIKHENKKRGNKMMENTKIVDVIYETVNRLETENISLESKMKENQTIINTLLQIKAMVSNEI